MDASVILKWVLGNEQEPDHDAVMRLFYAWVEGRAEMSAPKLWPLLVFSKNVQASS